jgi:hypothetical protein
MPTLSATRIVPLAADANLSTSPAFWRLFAWGAGATLALVVAIMAGRTELGAQRVHAALTAMFSAPPSPDQQLSEQMTAWSNGFDKQMRRQAEIIRMLGEQRDSLADKVGALERQLSELGGALARTTARLEGEARAAQQAAAAASVAAASATRLAQARPDPQETAPQAVAALAPLTPSPVRTVPATQPAPTTTASPPVSAAGAPLNLLPPGQIHPGTTAAGSFPTVGGPQPPPASTGTVPMPAAAEPNGPPGMMRPFPVQPTAEPMALPRPGNPKPAPPAALGASLAAAESAPSRPPLRAPMFQSNPLMTTGIFDAPTELGAITTEFAVDLGAAPTVDALRGRWNDLRASQSPLFDSMKPLVTLKESKSGQELHLIAGPLNSHAAGTRLCAVLSGTGVLCQPTVYEGQRLAAR